MKQFYHLCLTAHDEVLIRNEEDARQLINLSAIAAFRSDTEILTDSMMSSHVHLNAMTQSPQKFFYHYMESVTKDFNRRHLRKGRLFDKNPFSVRLEGPNRTQMSLCYGLRQGMHHGITQTPFEYPWSTCNSLFCNERGIREEAPFLMGPAALKDMFPRYAIIPEEWCVGRDGILQRRCFENLALVENWFGTARSYFTAMNRKTSEDWLREQEKDKMAGPKVTLQLLERGYSSAEVEQMLANEGSPKFIQRRKQDMDVCKLIDTCYLPRFGAESVYQLDMSQKMRIMDDLRRDHDLRNTKQLGRCLAMRY